MFGLFKIEGVGMPADLRAFGRLEGEVKSLRSEFNRFDSSVVLLHSKIDKLNTWKVKVVTGSLVAAVIVSLFVPQLSKLLEILIAVK